MTGKRSFWTGGILAALAIGAASLFLLPSLNREPNIPPPRVKSMSNLRQIGQAILLYSNDYNGQYPDSFRSAFMDVEMGSEVFVSPLRSETPAQGTTKQAVADQLSDPIHVSYVYLGRGFTTATVKPEDIVAYELPAQPNSGANVLFGDGHVEYEDASVIAKIVGRATTGIWPVTMPSP